MSTGHANTSDIIGIPWNYSKQSLYILAFSSGEPSVLNILKCSLRGYLSPATIFHFPFDWKMYNIQYMDILAQT